MPVPPSGALCNAYPRCPTGHTHAIGTGPGENSPAYEFGGKGGEMRKGRRLRIEHPIVTQVSALMAVGDTARAMAHGMAICPTKTVRTSPLRLGCGLCDG